MNFNLYSVRDNLANRFLHIFAEDNDMTAQRAFFNFTRTSPSPTDYELYRVGEWISENGEVVATQREFICSGGAMNGKS